MKPDSEPSSNDKIPSFFLEDDKTTENSRVEKNKKIDPSEPSLKTTTQQSKLTIHWPSLGIGAVIAIACIFFGIMMANMVDTESNYEESFCEWIWINWKSYCKICQRRF